MDFQCHLVTLKIVLQMRVFVFYIIQDAEMKWLQKDSNKVIYVKS